MFGRLKCEAPRPPSFLPGVLIASGALKGLTQLSTFNTKLTASGVKDFVRDRPNCKVKQ